MKKIYFDMGNTHDEAAHGTAILSENNLKVHIDYASNIGTNLPVDKEKSYCEFKYLSCSDCGWIGFVSNNKTANSKRLLLRIDKNGKFWLNYLESISDITDMKVTTGSIVGLALDKKNKRVGVYLNGKYKASVQLKTEELMFYPAVGCRSSGDNEGITAIANFGATPFTYPIPAGYQPLETSSRKRLYEKDNAIYGMQTTP